MNKFVFVALLTSLGLTLPGLAPAGSAPLGFAGQVRRAVRQLQTTTSWTCAHNTYRSVACP
jgi:hypothetical protein